MATSMKSTVTLLQELTIKKGFDAPEYTLIHTGQGYHNCEFNYLVTVHNTCAKGYGRSKNEAKHEAARLALDIFAAKGIYFPGESSEDHFSREDRTEGEPLTIVDKLMNVCLENKITTPEFIETSAVGPPHCREFTYECHIASIVTRAMADTKKEAKEMSAKEMLERVTEVLPELQEQDPKQPDEKPLTFKRKRTRIDVRSKKLDHNVQLKIMMKQKRLKRDEVMQYFSLPKTESTLQQLLDLFDFKYNFDIIQEHPFIVILNVKADSGNTFLSALDTASTLSEATTNTLNKMFTILRISLE